MNIKIISDGLGDHLVTSFNTNVLDKKNKHKHIKSISLNVMAGEYANLSIIEYDITNKMKKTDSDIPTKVINYPIKSLIIETMDDGEMGEEIEVKNAFDSIKI